MAFAKGEDHSHFKAPQYRRGKYTRQEAIDLNCKDCIYDDQDVGTWRQQVTACTIETCPFYDYRPTTTGPMPESM